MLSAFSHATKEEKLDEIDIVYPKLPPFGPPPKSKNEIEIIIQKWLLITYQFIILLQKNIKHF